MRIGRGGNKAVIPCVSVRKDEISLFENTGIFGILTYSSALLDDGLLIAWYKIQASGYYSVIFSSHHSRI
jgi:hypothetical protein